MLRGTLIAALAVLLASAPTTAASSRWTRNLSNDDGLRAEQATGAAAAPGTVFVAGYLNTPTSKPFGFVRRYASDGEVMWKRRGGDPILALAFDGEAALYVATYRHVRRLSRATGRVAWTYPLPAGNRDVDLTTHRGALLVAYAGQDDDWVVRLDRSDGHPTGGPWATHPGAGSPSLDVAITANDSGIYVAEDDFAVSLVKLSHTGDVAWRRAVGGSGADLGGIDAGRSEVFISYFRYTSQRNGFDAFLRAYDDDGSRNWTRQTMGPAW